MQGAVGARATAVRSQSYYLDVTPPGHDKGTFVEAMARRLGIPTDAVATIGDMENDLRDVCEERPVVRDGQRDRRHQENARRMSRPSNEDDGFAKAIELVLNHNSGGRAR